MKAWMIAGLMSAAVLAGCGDKSDRYGRTRPPVDELADGGRGLQGKDVITSSDRMASSLLSLPALNASQQQWTVVVDRVENLSVTQQRDLNIFLSRLRSRLAQMGQGRVQLIQNRETFRNLQARELDGPGDRFGQGGLGGTGGRVQPDYFLHAKLSELPNRESSYFLVEFMLTKVDGTIVWDDMYEVAAAR